MSTTPSHGTRQGQNGDASYEDDGSLFSPEFKKHMNTFSKMEQEIVDLENLQGNEYVSKSTSLVKMVNESTKNVQNHHLSGIHSSCLHHLLIMENQQGAMFLAKGRTPADIVNALACTTPNQNNDLGIHALLQKLCLDSGLASRVVCFRANSKHDLLDSSDLTEEVGRSKRPRKQVEVSSEDDQSKKEPEATNTIHWDSSSKTLVKIFRFFAKNSEFPLYKAISCPDSFEVSVENLFYVAFLCQMHKLTFRFRDKDIFVQAVGDNGTSECSVSAGKYVSTYSRELWRKCIEHYNIQKKFIDDT